MGCSCRLHLHPTNSTFRLYLIELSILRDCQILREYLVSSSIEPTYPQHFMFYEFLNTYEGLGS